MEEFDWHSWYGRALNDGKRPVVGTLCDQCYRLVPRVDEARWDISVWCGCDGVTGLTAEEEYSYHGIPAGMTFQHSTVVPVSE